LLRIAATLGIDPQEFTFLRHPIRDLSVPRRTHEMRDSAVPSDANGTGVGPFT
jgi:hypothetical protein